MCHSLINDDILNIIFSLTIWISNVQYGFLEGTQPYPIFTRIKNLDKVHIFLCSSDKYKIK